MGSFARISALLWADILVAYALFVMQNYLTEVWEISFTHAAGILNFWNGIVMMLPVVFLFFRDILLRNIGVLLISSMSYSAGIVFVWLSIPSILRKPCKELKSKCVGQNQEVLFYTGMALIAVGMAGNLISVSDFLKEQGVESDQSDDKGCNCLDVTKIFASPMIVIVPIVGAVALPYIKPWEIRFGIPALCTTVVFVTFWTGVFPCCWRYRFGDEPSGSPVTKICRVFVASSCKICKPQGGRYYSRDGEVNTFTKTQFLRCLEKAAIIEGGVSLDEQVSNRWRLCTVAEVEEAKIAVRMIPMWLTFIICGVVSSFGNTYFIEQGKKLDRHIGKLNLPIPAFLLFYKFMKHLLGGGAAKLVSEFRTYGPQVGIGIGMVFSILCCVTASRIEKRRLNVVREHGLLDKPGEAIPMSIYWLLFQFFLLAGLGSFLEKCVDGFYKRQAPNSMKKYMVHLTRAVFGLGYMANVLMVHVVGGKSTKGGKQNWFQFTLNKSRLDRYYMVLAVISCVNLGVYVAVASRYRYRNRQEPSGENGHETNFEGVESGEPEHQQVFATFGL